MDIRTLTRDDVDDSLRLSAFAFQQEVNPQAWQERREKHRPENIWGVFEEGRLAAKMAIHPLHVYLQGQSFATGGVASVATWPEYRRQGLVSRLLVHGLNVMRERGQTVSLLAPFAFGFYRKFGWETYVDRKHYTITAAQLPRFGAYEGKFVRKDPANDWGLLNEIYDVYARKYGGMLVRDEMWWTDFYMRYKRGGVSVHYDGEGRPDAYLLYEVMGSEMIVYDLAFLDEGSRKAVWSFIANHDSMIERVLVVAPLDDPLPYLLDEPTIQQEIRPHFMARVVDVAAFLRQYPFAVMEEELTIIWVIEDKQAEWNNGAFQVKVRDGKAEVSTTGGGAGTQFKSDARSQVLSCTIQTFSSMMFCYMQPSVLRTLGKLSGDEEAVMKWEALIPPQTPFLMDYF